MYTYHLPAWLIIYWKRWVGARVQRTSLVHSYKNEKTHELVEYKPITSIYMKFNNLMENIQ